MNRRQTVLATINIEQRKAYSFDILGLSRLHPVYKKDNDIQNTYA